MNVLLLALMFTSGWAALVYEVLWMRALTRVFGATALAAAMTLAVFFLGLAIGSYLWGQRASRFARPLRVYGWLEVAVGVAAGTCWLLFDVYQAWYPSLFEAAHETPGALLLLQVLLACIALLPPAVLMGGTLPMMAQHLVRRRDELAVRSTLLYAANTLGGAAGAFTAAFYLVPTFGYRGAITAAIGVSQGVGVAALAISAIGTIAAATADTQEPAGAAKQDLHGMATGATLTVAALSGFTALGLEVLWTLMFAQVLHNSVYSFALILTTFLLALALGAFFARWLCRFATPALVLCTLLLLAGLAAGATPFVFFSVTDGLGYVAALQSWPVYVRKVFLTAVVVMLLPGLLIGSVFPYLLRVVRPASGGAGRVVGHLTAINTAGAVAGSLLAGFVAVPWLGVFGGIRMLALLYFVAVLLLADAAAQWRLGLRVAAAAGVLLLATALDPARLPILRLWPNGGESVHEKWETPQGVVAVTRTGADLRVRVDNYYMLGTSGARSYEETQADVPLVMHPQPRSVFFLGLGTGITAGAALRHPIERLTAVELIPEVVTASRKYFGEYTNGLFTDSRARVLVADGRAYLAGTAERFDVIVSDLFIPWQAGAADLYTREHFEAVKARLEPGGIFAQWLPLFQLSRDEAFIIIRTMLDVFPQVTLWRGDFHPDRPAMALIGEGAERPLDVEAMVANFRRRRQSAAIPRAHVTGMMGLFYAGNLGALRARFAAYPANTDDRPVIEWSSPMTQRTQRANQGLWFTTTELLEWQEELQRALPVEDDPYLSTLEPDEHDFVRAGLSLYQARTYRFAKRETEADAAAEQFRALAPVEIARLFKQQVPEQRALENDPRREEIPPTPPGFKGDE